MIVIEVSCDDELFRTVVAELLSHQRDMVVLRDADAQTTREPEGRRPDVVVFGVGPRGDVAHHAPEYRDMAARGTAIVVFCTTSEQAEDFGDLGVEHLVDANEPARELAKVVRAAYRHRGGRTIH